MTTTGAGVDYTAAVGALESARSVTVLCHVQPDADTLGSGLALAAVLDRRGVPVRVSFADPAEPAASLRTLPGARFLVAPAEVPDEVDLLVTVDCGSAGRLGALADRLPGAARTLVIDHHRSNTLFGDINLIDPDAVSTASVITALLDAWGEPIDADIAHCLFAGLATDSGSFRWVTPGTHALAERLLATGIDGAAITRTLMDTHPFAWLRMLSTVLASASLDSSAHDGTGLVAAFVTAADLAEVRQEEAESVVDIVRATAEAGIAAVFKEAGPAGERRRWTVSLRSKDAGPAGGDGADVAAIATDLGGGGHRYAAGYTTYGEPAEILAQLRAALG
ncbi:MAG: bifunctional oligoribonuclease/PAP phosphatase NrnA [Nocardia sp.]|nr:bifunctional oligoribonuclease/PAP phosphatase NrnA [Nocardia sp.]